MEKICSGNYENVLSLIERAEYYYVWIQTNETDGLYDCINRQQFENKMIDKIEDNNCHIEDLYLNDDGELYYKDCCIEFWKSKSWKSGGNNEYIR